LGGFRKTIRAWN